MSDAWFGHRPPMLRDGWQRPSPETVIAYCRIYDVPPWVSVWGPPRPRAARLRWWLRRVFPRLVWGRT